MELTLRGVTGALEHLGNKLPVPFRLTRLGSLSVAQVEPRHYEATKAGLRFAGGTQVIANGIAPVTAIPTTTATLALFNNSQDKDLVLDKIHYLLGSGTPTAGSTLYVAVTNRRLATLPTADATNYASGAMNGSGKQSETFWVAGATVSVDAWAAITSNLQLASANVGQGDQPVDLAGRFVVPPQHAFCIAILSGTGTSPLYSVSAEWLEKER